MSRSPNAHGNGFNRLLPSTSAGKRRCVTKWPRIPQFRLKFQLFTRAEVLYSPRAFQVPVHAFRRSEQVERRQCASSSGRRPQRPARARQLSSRPFSAWLPLQALFFLLGHSRKMPLLSVFSTRYGLPHSGHFCGNRFVVRGELALGIVRAAPEDVSSARLALGNISHTALGALHAFNQVLLDVFALADSQSMRRTRRRLPGAAPTACRTGGRLRQ